MEISQILEHSDKLITGVSALIGAVTGGITAVKAKHKVTKDLLSKVETLQKGLDAITTELSPNGGSSFRDKVTRIEESIDLLKARWRLSLTSSSIGQYECDAEGQCTYANRALCEMFGLDESQMMGNGWLASIDHTDRARVWDDWVRDIAKDIPYEDRYTVVNARTGERIPVKTIAVAHRSRVGKILGFYGRIERV